MPKNILILILTNLIFDKNLIVFFYFGNANRIFKPTEEQISAKKATYSTSLNLRQNECCNFRL